MAGRRMRAKLQQIKQELRARMHEPVEATGNAPNGAAHWPIMERGTKL